MAKTASHIGTADILSPPNMESSSSTERQKELKLLPRGKSTPISENTPDTLPVKLTEAKTDKKLVNMLAEFWSVMDVQVTYDDSRFWKIFISTSMPVIISLTHILFLLLSGIGTLYW